MAEFIGLQSWEDEEPARRFVRPGRKGASAMLTSRERLEHADALRAYLEGLGHEALQRVASAEKWGDWHYCYPDGRRCLLGHAEDWTFNARTRCPVEPTGSQCGHSPGEDAFHALVEEDGVKRVAALCRHYAEHLLGTRLRALVGTDREASTNA